MRGFSLVRSSLAGTASAKFEFQSKDQVEHFLIRLTLPVSLPGLDRAIQ
jgi:hypothetical protein